MRWLAAAAALALPACGTPAPAACDPDIEVLPADLPPTDVAMLDEWLAARSWESWDCEAAPHPATDPSPHGSNRICQNRLVTACLEDDGRFPVGATLVKESFDAEGTLTALFVETRISEEDGPGGWYFVRREEGSGAVVDNAPFCAGCHATSPRDFVWSTVP